MISLLTPREHYDTLIDPNTGFFLETDGKTIWLLHNEKRIRNESNTMAWVINEWLNEGRVSRIYE